MPGPGGTVGFGLDVLRPRPSQAIRARSSDQQGVGERAHAGHSPAAWRLDARHAASREFLGASLRREKARLPSGLRPLVIKARQ